MKVDMEKLIAMILLSLAAGLGVAFIAELGGVTMNWWDRLAWASFIGGGLFLELYVHHFDKFLKRWD